MNPPLPKVLIVADTYYPKIDGVLRFLEEFIKRSQDHFELSLLVPHFSHQASRQAAVREVKTFFLETSKIIKPLPTYPSIKLSFKNLKKIKKAVKEAEIVFVQGPALASCLSVYYAHRYRKKIVCYVHVLPWELFEKSAPSFLKQLFYPLLKRIVINSYNQSNLLLLPYPALEEELPDYGVKAPLQVARLGVDISHFLPSPDKAASKAKLGLPNKTIVGYVGRLSREKNPGILLRAFRRLNPQKYFLLIIGDGQPELVAEFRQNKNCLVTGFVNNVVDYLQAMDIFVMPSLVETTSLATLEAMSCGLPVIVTKVGFMEKYIIKDYNGLFFPRASPAVLALKIEKLRKNPALREKLSQNARQTAAHSFSWERSINKIKSSLLKIYYQP